MICEYDVLIIGGIACLVTALTAAEKCLVASMPQKNRSYASYIEDQEEILQQLHPTKKKEKGL